MRIRANAHFTRLKVFARIKLMGSRLDNENLCLFLLIANRVNNTLQSLRFWLLLHVVGVGWRAQEIASSIFHGFKSCVDREERTDEGL